MRGNDPDIIATKGIHWHPTLEIYVDEELIEIPENIGLLGGHNPVHTHDDLPIIHLEFSGIVREDDIKLVRFFDVWGKDFMEFGDDVVMMVNGVENTEYTEYIMQHEDKIELRYTTNGS